MIAHGFQVLSTTLINKLNVDMLRFTDPKLKL